MVEVNTVGLDSGEIAVAEALQNADAQLQGLTEALAKNSTGASDVGTIKVGTIEFNASDSAAGFVVGQIANRLSQGMSTTVVPETKKDEIAKTISQKAG